MTARGPSGAADAAGGLIVVDHCRSLRPTAAAGYRARVNALVEAAFGGAARIGLVRRRLAARRVTSVSQQRMPAEEIVRGAG